MGVSNDKLIEIDGSYGEGGGQVLRTSLALSAILGTPFFIHHIRSKRKNKGLQAQHLEAVKSIGQITQAHIKGAQLGSTEISFSPDKIIAGDYRFEVKTAGSVTLLLQAILLPLCFTHETSRLTLTGGTHVPWSPSFHYFSLILLPTLKKMGVSARASIEKWGFFPEGGGKIELEIDPVDQLKPVRLVERGALKKILGLSAGAHLPRHVADRQRDQALKRIREEFKMEAEVEVLYDVPSNGPGSFLFLAAEYEKSVVGFSSLGSRGKPAEQVADEALNSLKEYVDSQGCIDPYLADQLLPFMALAGGTSSITTTKITQHLLTNLWVIQKFLKINILRSEERDGEKIEIGK